ncbi:hypothetical protein KPSA3_03101 [Pseudomonas syringae pv. actinidiae]|uniref:Uncharacterized protein n=1 Tax=Pseudomonas syringae pv. actinidiae TaxID=103796 RepID=A0AAN4Q598_PSESF|nr:hypothetical protein KPSA3_03101 [Pseudomonas syringae pv. actinidiae]
MSQFACLSPCLLSAIDSRGKGIFAILYQVVIRICTIREKSCRVPRGLVSCQGLHVDASYSRFTLCHSSYLPGRLG